MRNHTSPHGAKVSQQEIANPNCNCLLSDQSEEDENRQAGANATETTALPETAIAADGDQALINKTKSRKRLLITGTKRLTLLATFTAIAIVLKYVSNFVPLLTTKLSFIYVAWILAAVILGPVDGLVVGLVSDLLGMILMPTGNGINPINTLSNALFPFIVGLAVRFLPLKNDIAKVCIGTVISMLCCTLGLSTLGLSITYGTPYFALLLTRWTQLIVVAINLATVCLLLPLMKKIKLLN